MTLAILLSLVATGSASDLGVRGGHLVINDSVADDGKATVTFSAFNDTGIQKGAAGSTSNLEGTLEVFYTDRPGNLSKFNLASGSAWRRNDDGGLKYLNRDGKVRSLSLQPGKRLRLRAKALGETSSWLMNLAEGGVPSDNGGITTIVTIRNGNDSSVHRMCTRFNVASGSSVSLYTTHGGLGRKLVASRGVPVNCDRLSYFRMEPDLARGFFAAPWPNDIRLLANGTLDMEGFPLPAGNAIAQTILSNGAAITKGFGPNAAVFIQTAAPIDPASLPTAESSTQADSPVMLVNLDDPLAPRTPILLDLKESIGALRPPDLLSVLPYPGHPLAGKTRYAVIFFDGIKSPEGNAFGPAPLLAELDEPWDADKPVDATKWAALKTQRDDVYEYVSNHTSWTSSQVVAFTVYTTQDVTGELEAIAAAVNALPQPTPLSRGAGNCSGGALRTTVSGQLRLPHWQAGTYPYVSSGGGIVVSNGLAVQQSTEDVLLQMTFPCGPAPANGWPILLFMTGTGGGANSSNISYLGGNSNSNPLPYVVASIAPLYSGDRYVSGLPAPYDQSEFLFFNYINSLAGRTNQLQQVGDMMYLRRVIQGIQLTAAETGNASPVATNDNIIVIAGHSQGALTIPQTLAVDTKFTAGFISAGGGGLYQTILHRGDVRIPLTAVIGSSANEMDMFHPLPHAVQTFAEIGDAANYAPLVHDAHILSTSGLIDGCSPVEAVSVLGTSLGLEVANPLYFPVFGSTTLEPPTTTFPVTGNLADGRTGITVQLDAGHFGAATNPNLGRSFVDSHANGGVPTINPGALLSSTVEGCPRFDALP